MKKLTVEQRDTILVHMPIEWDSDKFYDWLNENTEEEERFKPYFCRGCELPASGCECK